MQSKNCVYIVYINACDKATHTDSTYTEASVVVYSKNEDDMAVCFHFQGLESP